MVDRREMSFWEHLEELRWRIFKCLGAILAGGIATYIFSDFLLEILVAPGKSLEIPLNLQVLKVTSMFMVKLSVSLMGGIVIGFPVVVLQVWQFIKPAFEKDYTFAAGLVVLFASLCLAAGICFGYFVIIPFSLGFFTSLTSETVAVNYNFTLNDYLTYVLWLVFACGLVFQLPVVTFFFTRLGILTTERLRKYRKFAFLGFLIIGAVLTPPDPLSQVLIVLPLLILYEFSIFLSWLSGLSKRNTENPL